MRQTITAEFYGGPKCGEQMRLDVEVPITELWRVQVPVRTDAGIRQGFYLAGHNGRYGVTDYRNGQTIYAMIWQGVPD